MMENLGIHQLFSPGTDAAVRVSRRELGQLPDKKAQGTDLPLLQCRAKPSFLCSTGLTLT